MTIRVTIRSVYGNERIYPICDLAKTFAKLTNSITLSRESISLIKSLGYSIQVITEEL